jgi:hypothetical protein
MCAIANNISLVGRESQYHYARVSLAIGGAKYQWTSSIDTALTSEIFTSYLNSSGFTQQSSTAACTHHLSSQVQQRLRKTSVIGKSTLSFE